METADCKRITDDPFVGLQVVRYLNGGRNPASFKDLRPGSVLVVEDVGVLPIGVGALPQLLARCGCVAVCEATAPSPGILDGAYPPGKLRPALDIIADLEKPSAVIFAKSRQRVEKWLARAGRWTSGAAPIAVLQSSGGFIVLNAGAFHKEAA